MEGGAYVGELASGIIYLLAGTRLVLLVFEPEKPLSVCWARVSYHSVYRASSTALRSWSP